MNGLPKVRRTYGFPPRRNSFCKIRNSEQERQTIKSMPLEIMKSYVGHSTSMDTYGIYGHDVDGELQYAANFVEGTIERILKGEK